MEIKLWEYLVHTSDLLHLLSLFGVIAAVKYGSYDSLNRSSKALTLPRLYLVFLCVGATVQILGTLYPGAPHLKELWGHFNDLVAKSSRSQKNVSQFSLLIHMMSVSEFAYEIILSLFAFVISFGLLLQTVLGGFSSLFYKPPPQPANQNQQANPTRKKLPERSTVFLLFSVVLGSAALVATVFACADTPKFVRPNTPLEAFPMISKCAPHRFGAFSLIQVLAVLNSVNSLWEIGQDNKIASKSLALSLLIDFIAAILLLTSFLMKANFQVEELFSKGSSSWKVHLVLVCANIAVYILFFIPKLLQSNSLLVTLAISLTGVGISIFLEEGFNIFLEDFHFQMINATVFCAGAMSAVIIGYPSAIAGMFLASVILNVHEGVFL